MDRAEWDIGDRDTAVREPVEQDIVDRDTVDRDTVDQDIDDQDTLDKPAVVHTAFDKCMAVLVADWGAFVGGLETVVAGIHIAKVASFDVHTLEMVGSEHMASQWVMGLVTAVELEASLIEERLSLSSVIQVLRVKRREKIMLVV